MPTRHARGHGAGPSQRQLRAGELIRHALVEILREEEFADPELEAVSVTVTEARKEKFDFSSYRLDVLGFYVPTESTIQSIKEPKDIAGLRVIVGAGTNQEKILVEWDKQNQAAGLKAAEFQYYDDSAASQLALQSGRADVEFNPNAQLAYRAVVNGKTRLVGIVNGGQMVASGTMAELREQARTGTATLEEIFLQVTGGPESRELAAYLGER